MTLIDTIKAALGLGDATTTDRDTDSTAPGDGRTDPGDPETTPGPSGDRTPAEPDAATERAVKTEPADERDASAGTSPDASPAATADTPADRDAADTTAINGIGSAYADRLAAAGVETVADLAGADAEALAAETDLSVGRIEGWIEQAEARTA